MKLHLFERIKKWRRRRKLFVAGLITREQMRDKKSKPGLYHDKFLRIHRDQKNNNHAFGEFEASFENTKNRSGP